MDNNMQGDLSALQAVMEQEGMGGAALNQVTPNSPTAKPNLAPPNIQPQGSPNPQGMPPVQSGAPNPQVGLPAGDPEADLILKAMSKRLDTLGKLGR